MRDSQKAGRRAMPFVYASAYANGLSVATFSMLFAPLRFSEPATRVISLGTQAVYDNRPAPTVSLISPNWDLDQLCGDGMNAGGVGVRTPQV
ncbi:MAG: hypothetical protein AAFX39_15990 [Pseudomonadota bacterium]